MSSRFTPGNPKPPSSGRRKGGSNRVTREIRATLAKVLSEPASEVRLRALRDSRSAVDRAVFWRLAGRLIPVAIEGKLEGMPLLTVIDYSDRRVDEDPAEVDRLRLCADAETAWESTRCRS